jgi:glycosyltransferase involved in cell wall biosynthesis
VPVYNAEKYLERCLDSITGQTLREIEIVCVNDGSTDGSSAILDEYAQKDPRVIVFHQENKGPGAARNTALDNIKGRYVLFCDADDTLEPCAASECLRVMESDFYDLIVFCTKIIETNRKLSAAQNLLSGEIYPSVSSSNMNINAISCLKMSSLGNVWGYMFKADIINKFNLRFTHYMAFEDIIFKLSYFMVIKKACLLDLVLYNYNIRNGSLMFAVEKGTWFNRLAFLPKLLCNTFIFTLRNRIAHRELYVFFWLFVWISRRMK